MIIRNATEKDVRQIAEIIVEDWQTAYRGIIDDEYLDSLSVDERHQRELKRYGQYKVAVDNDEVIGLAWNAETADEPADCEIIALYVRYSKRNNGIGKALMQNAMDSFREAGKKCMIIWCLEGNLESRKFYEKMGGKENSTGTHSWGNREYNMTSYLYKL